MHSVFDDIVGQQQAINLLEAAWQSGRMPHALIFAGPTGVGKRSTADRLAGLFLCPRPHGLMPCGSCTACSLLAAGNHPDISISRRQDIRLYKESVARDLAIDVIRRQLVEPAGMKPAMGHGRVFIVEEADRMSDNAQNSLLKTLEEPQGHRTLILLLATSEDELLSTVRSRSRVVRFSPLPQQQTVELLRRITPDHASLEDAARIAEGSVGQALRWINLGLVPVAVGLESRISRLVSGEPVSDLSDWLKSGADGVVEKLCKQDPDGSKDQFKRETLATLFAISTQELRRAMRRMSGSAQLERLCTMVDHLDRASTLLGSNVNADLVLANLSAQLNP